MGNNFTPILVVPAVPHEGGIRFLHRNGQIDISPDIADKLWQILSYTNGYNSISEIARLAQLSNNEVSDIMLDLTEMGLVTNSTAQYAHFHLISNYPATFGPKLTQDEIADYTKSARLPVKSGKALDFDINEYTSLCHIMKNRRSCRSFLDQKLSLEEVGNICHYAYSISKHSTPSGGALYPLKIFVLMEGTGHNISPGYYEYDAEKDNLVLFNDEIDLEQLKYCFNQEEMPFSSSAQIVIAADLGRQPYKYGNRGYRLTLLEAGHVAENISLYCAEQKFGACELGGVLDEPLAQELDFPDGVWPLLTIAVGFPSDYYDEPFDKIRFVEENTGPNRPVKEVWSATFASDGSFFGATATYLDGLGNTQYAGATSVSYADAIFKATVEGYERWLSGQTRVDFCGPAKELTKNWLDPRHIIPLTPEQAQKCGIEPFTEDLAINWTLGTDANGSDIYVPSDLIYYGQKDSKNRIYYGNSSGTAAHFNFDEAKKRAVVELIERDALMTNWFAQRPPHHCNGSGPASPRQEAHQALGRAGASNDDFTGS